MTSIQLKAATRQDPVLNKVLHYTKRGWPLQVPESLKPYWNRRMELSLEDDCVMWSIRVVVPRKLQEPMRQELHQSHPGIVRMKSIARSYVWWPGIDHDIEQLAKSCVQCQAVKNTPAVAPLHPWNWPSRPWQRIHIDFAGPFLGRTFMVVVDAHSKWPEVIEMKTTTASSTIQELRTLFASYGLPEQLVSDNGPQFVSGDFACFLKRNGVKHIRCAPYHPSSNGAAERFVKTFKNAMKAGDTHGPPFHQRLMNFLLTYRSTPHATTNVAPCTLFLNRHVRTRFDLLRPDVDGRVASKQAEQKRQHDLHAKKRDLFIGQRVMVRNLRPGPRWIPGTVVERNGPLSYLVQVNGNQMWKRHIDHLQEMGDSPYTTTTGVTESSSDMNTDFTPGPASREPEPQQRDPTVDVPSSADSNNNSHTDSNNDSTTITDPTPVVQPPRYPQRNRVPPERLI